MQRRAKILNALENIETGQGMKNNRLQTNQRRTVNFEIFKVEVE